MKNIEFKYIEAKNFLCFGNEGIRIEFNNMEKICFVKGRNGTGKSSIIDIILWGIYGETARNLNADSVIHKKTKKCYVEIAWNKFKIIRTRKSNNLELYEYDGSEWIDRTRGKMSDTQEDILAAVGISFQAFMSIISFSDDNSSSFLEADIKDKRKIIENLLGLEKFVYFLAEAKAIESAASRKVEDSALIDNGIVQSIARLQKDLQDLEIQESSWKRKNLEALENNLKIIKEESLKTFPNYEEEIKKYEESQEKILSNNDIISKANANLTNAQSYTTKAINAKNQYATEISKIDGEISSINYKIKEYNSNKSSIYSQISRLQKLENGVQCNSCLGKIDTANASSAINKLNESIQSLDDLIKDCNKKIESPKKNRLELSEKLRVADEAEKKGKEGVAKYQNQIKNLQSETNQLSRVLKPTKDVEQTKSEKRKLEAELQCENIKKIIGGPSPYEETKLSKTEQIATTKNQLDESREKTNSLKEDLPYYAFCKMAFGDNGIRKFAIDQIIDLLNKSIEYWMDLLIDNQIIVTFDDELKVSIKKISFQDEEFVYHSMSRGQKRRMNLAVMLGIARVMSIVNNVNTNIIFLDEVSTNIDEEGIQGIYSIIQELSLKKKVFITTHDKELENMFSEVASINLTMKDGVTTIKK